MRGLCDRVLGCNWWLYLGIGVRVCVMCSAENWDGDSVCVIRVRFSLTDVVVVVLWIIERGLRVERVSAPCVSGDDSKCWPACAAHTLAVEVSGVKGWACADQSDPLALVASENMLRTLLYVPKSDPVALSVLSVITAAAVAAYGHMYCLVCQPVCRIVIWKYMFWIVDKFYQCV